MPLASTSDNNPALLALAHRALPLTNTEDTQILSYGQVASTMLVSYDVLLTLSDEVKYIWRTKPWHLTSVLYLGARYLPCITELALLSINLNGVTGLERSRDTCRAWIYVQGVMLQLIVTVVDAVLLIRVRALYYDSKKLIAVLVVLFAVETVGLCIILGNVEPTISVDTHCFVTDVSVLLPVYWITSLAFETLLFSLTLLKFIAAVRAGWGRRPVMKQFVTDGTWAFALIFLTMLVNALLYPLAHTPLAGICFTWLLSVLSIAGSRLLLNPRRMLGDGEASDTVNFELTEFVFAEV
ncbi:hypothetical protein BV25DRAFT_1172755 [Artomyces pyxidatus]|uniref:Uncharacterized protein n=1 Tax=Artomyces pyxidatus TaxID=48021 RepID=A0ACB8SRE5_9AGAM|nr:hypothetical protein BV25DRAFT_1172755 [Artomyces pyxidatus]